jgi:hypothetical protein
MKTTIDNDPKLDSGIEGRWVHPLCKPLAVELNGPFLDAPGGGLLSVDAQGLRLSQDDGHTWSETTPACHGQHPREPGSFYLVRARDNALVMVYLDLANYLFTWDDATGEPKDGCHLELCAIRSQDGGKTWGDRQVLLDGYNANFFGFIRLRNGRLVVVAEHLASHPGRWVVCSFVSDDDGRTWQRSNLIDLGGHGHHDGAVEPTVAELSDGRLLMLIRTNLDRFWQAISEDGGRYWRTIEPSQIDASSSPGFLLRLQSGRLLLVWNRLNPVGGTWPKGGVGPAMEAPASWHREELSAAFSEDDGKSWTTPVVVARQKDGQLSYPYVFERRPGELWIVAGFAFRKGWQDAVPLRLQVREEDLLDEAKKPA